MHVITLGLFCCSRHVWHEVSVKVRQRTKRPLRWDTGEEFQNGTTYDTVWSLEEVREGDLL